MYKLTVVLVSALLCVAAVNAFTGQGGYSECSCNTKGTEILKADQCVKITCDEDDGSFGHLVGCGVADIKLTRTQELRGCQVKQKQVSSSVRYPECCEKYVDCPPVSPSDDDVATLYERFLRAKQ